MLEHVSEKAKLELPVPLKVRDKLQKTFGKTRNEIIIILLQLGVHPVAVDLIQIQIY
jgi:hypothetical protein